MTAASGDRLRRVLGLGEVTASGVGIIIGAGIYVLIGPAAERAGGAVWLGFLLAALLSIFTALSYAELAALFPRASAEYEYTRQTFPHPIAFMVGLVMVVGLVVASGAVSLGFGRYLGAFLPVDQHVGSLLLLAGVAIIALAGIQQSARLTQILSAVQIGGLLVIIVIGLPHLGDRDLLAMPNGPQGVLAAAALIFFAFIGFDEVNTLAEETRNPTWTIPRALLLSLSISGVLYMVVAVTAVSVVGADALARSERPLADVMAHDLGDRAGLIVAVIALISTANTTLLALTAGSRLLFGMASQGALPSWMAAVDSRRQTPYRAIGLAIGLAAAVSFVGEIALIASITDFAVYVVFLAVNATVILLRFRQPDLPRPIKTPGSIGRLPILPVLGIATVLLMLTQLDVRAALAGIAITVVALGLGSIRSGPKTSVKRET